MNNDWYNQIHEFLKDSKGVVHIGANTGQERDRYAAYDLPVIWVEGLPDICERLRENIVDYHNQKAYSYLLTDQDGKEYDVGVASNGARSSSIFDLCQHRLLWPDITYQYHHPIYSLTFKTMVKREQINLDGFDTLILDVQGAELLVLRGMGDLVKHFKMIRAEAADFEIYKGCCRVDDLDRYLADYGFKSIKRYEGIGKEAIGKTYEVLYLNTQHADIGSMKVGAVMSTPRVGFLATSDLIYRVCMELGWSFARGEGAFWHHSLTRCIESHLETGHDYIVIVDYDTIFTKADGAKLILHLYDNPEVDIVAPMLLKREGGEMALTSDGEVTLNNNLIPITQAHFGLTAIRATAFDKIPRPWFIESPSESGQWGEGRIDPDIHFWNQCRKVGIKMMAATDVVTGHLEQVVTWPKQDFTAHYQTMNDWRKNGKPEWAFQKPPALTPARMEMKD